LLIAWSASLGAFIWNGSDAWLNQHIFRVEPHNQCCTKDFLFHAVRHAIDELYDKAHGTGMVHVTKPVFEAHEVPLPPLNEQSRITAKLTEILAKVDACQRRLAKIPVLLKRFRQSVLAAACSGRLTADWREENPDDTNVSGASTELPRSWNAVEFGEFISEGPQNGLYKPESFYGDGTFIVRIDAFYDGEIETWDKLKRLRLTQKERSQFALRNGDIVINRVNSPKFLGKSALVRKLEAPCVYESNMMRIRLNTRRSLPDYAILYLQCPAGLVELRKNAKHAINQSSINQEDVKSAMFNLPPLPEQQEIVRRVEALFALADQIEARFDKAQAHVDKLTQSVLGKAFRGELVPQDPNDEPASVLLERIRNAKNGKPPNLNATKKTKPVHRATGNLNRALPKAGGGIESKNTIRITRRS
jgi:type I restriction enzyme S subunit